jgi:hypothetical protein
MTSKCKIPAFPHEPNLRYRYFFTPFDCDIYLAAKSWIGPPDLFGFSRETSAIPTHPQLPAHQQEHTLLWALSGAAAAGRIDLIRYLLGCISNPLATTIVLPLCVACRHGQLSALELLVGWQSSRNDAHPGLIPPCGVDALLECQTKECVWRLCQYNYIRLQMPSRIKHLIKHQCEVIAWEIALCEPIVNWAYIICHFAQKPDVNFQVTKPNFVELVQKYMERTSDSIFFSQYVKSQTSQIYHENMQ